MEKLDLYRHATQTLTAGGAHALAERHWHPDMVFEEPAALPDGGVYYGRDAAAARLAERLEIGAGTRVDFVHATDAGGHDVLVELRIEVIPEEGGAALVFPWFQLATVDDGRVLHIREFTDRDEALRAAGLDG